MRVDESVFVAGEDISWGGTVKLAYGLAEKFPGRVLDAPISETAIAGLGLGAAMMGMRPVIDLNLMDFTLCAFDEIANEIAKYRFMSAGKLEIPLVIHVSSGAMAGAGPQHCQSLESLYAHMPGLKVVVASTPADGAGLMRVALRDPDPVVFIDCVSTSGLKGPVPEGDYLVPLGRARVARAGNDATVLTYGSVVDAALEAAEELSRDGVSVEVVDLRSLVPLDMETVAASVAKTGHVAIAHEAVRQGGFGAEVAARIAEECFESLRAPVVRLGAPFEPVPFAPALKQRYYVGAADIARAVSELVDTRG
jgi:pyruvate/2-oxoglutarate/acetoin dehydrogenase E1 component